MAPDQFREPIVALRRDLGRFLGSRDDLKRRQRQADDLHVVAELVEHAEPASTSTMVRMLGHALADVLSGRSLVDELVEELLREDVVEDVDFHGSSCVELRFTGIAAMAQAADVAIRAGAAAAQNVRLAPPP